MHASRKFLQQLALQPFGFNMAARLAQITWIWGDVQEAAAGKVVDAGTLAPDKTYGTVDSAGVPAQVPETFDDTKPSSSTTSAPSIAAPAERLGCPVALLSVCQAYRPITGQHTHLLQVRVVLSLPAGRLCLLGPAGRLCLWCPDLLVVLLGRQVIRQGSNQGGGWSVVSVAGNTNPKAFCQKPMVGCKLPTLWPGAAGGARRARWTNGAGRAGAARTRRPCNSMQSEAGQGRAVSACFLVCVPLSCAE